MPSGFIIHTVKDALAAALGILESEQHEVAWIVPPSVHALSMNHGLFEAMKTFVKHGGVSRGIVTVSRGNVDEIRMCVESGEDLRHSDAIHELFMYVGDTQQSVSAVNIGVSDYTLEASITAFWSESSTYAEFLLASFENAWSRATPAEQIIERLEKKQPTD